MDFTRIGLVLALDFTFAMLTGMTGIHGLIVDAGASLGSHFGIEPLFDAHMDHVAYAGDVGHEFNTGANAGHAGEAFSGSHVDASGELHMDHAAHSGDVGHDFNTSANTDHAGETISGSHVDTNGELHMDDHSHADHSGHNHHGLEYDPNTDVVKKDSVVQFGQKYLKPHMVAEP